MGTRLFNEHAGSAPRPVFGAVTTGEAWQFLRLDGGTVTLHRDRLFVVAVGAVLAALQAILAGGRTG